MGSFSNSLQPAGLKQLTIVRKDASSQPTDISEHVFSPEDDGLGCVRGFAVAMIFNLALALVIAAGWEAWLLLR
jgi:hypothetical protein